MKNLIIFIPFLMFTNFSYIVPNHISSEVYLPPMRENNMNLVMSANETRTLLNELQNNKQLLKKLENEGNINNLGGSLR